MHITAAAWPTAGFVAPQVQEPTRLVFELEVRNSWGSSTDTVTFTIRPGLRITCEAVGPLEARCRSDRPGVPHAWTFADRATSSDESPVHAFPRPGTYGVWLTVEDTGGGESAQTEVTFEEPPAVLQRSATPREEGGGWPVVAIALAAALAAAALLLLVAVRRRRRA